MIKKLLFTLFAALCLTPSAQAFIIDIQTFTKTMPDGMEQTIYLFGDMHIESPLNQQHMFKIFKLALTLGAKSTAFIAEDPLAQINTDIGEHIGQQIFTSAYRTSYLAGLSILSKQCNFATTNIEFRIVPELAHPIETRYNFDSHAVDYALNHIRTIIKPKIQQLLTYNDSPETNAFYTKAYKQLTDPTNAESIFSIEQQLIKHKYNPFRYVDHHYIYDFINAEIIHALYNYQNKQNIIVCAGAIHTAQVAKILCSDGYHKHQNTGDPAISRIALTLNTLKFLPQTKEIQAKYPILVKEAMMRCERAQDPTESVQQDINSLFRSLVLQAENKKIKTRLPYARL